MKKFRFGLEACLNGFLYIIECALRTCPAMWISTSFRSRYVALTFNDEYRGKLSEILVLTASLSYATKMDNGSERRALP
jgi:hypothetical protein